MHVNVKRLHCCLTLVFVLVVAPDQLFEDTELRNGTNKVIINTSLSTLSGLWVHLSAPKNLLYPLGMVIFSDDFPFTSMYQRNELISGRTVRLLSCASAMLFQVGEIWEKNK